MRHAKSDWYSFDGNDIERKVSKKGIKKTKLTGSFLKKKKICIDKIICSPSKRTTSTSDLIVKYLDNRPEVEIVGDIYYGNENDLHEIVKKTDNKYKNLLVIGHEPVLSNFVEEMTLDKSNQIYKRAVWKFTTSSFFNFSFNTLDWNEVNEVNSKVCFYYQPEI